MRAFRLAPLALSIAVLSACAQLPSTAPPAAVAAPDVTAALTPQQRVGFFVDRARHGDRVAVQKEIDAGIDVNQFDTMDQTALIAAISFQSKDVVSLLLDHHADPNLPDNAGWTPIIFGAYFGTDPTLMQMLLDHGANINARNDRGITALYLASATGHEEQVKYLLAHGADKTLASNNGYTPQRVAEVRGLGKIVALLGGAPAPASGAGAAPINSASAKTQN